LGSSEAHQQDAFKNRPTRVTSHALVEVRRFKHLPFFAQSAVLLDISLGGFKIEFTGETQVKPGTQCWLSIPLRPLGIYSPERLVCQAECRWFDSHRYRVGGVFMSLTKTERLIIEQILDALKERGVPEA
jgi:hypothetical protein